MPHPCKKKLLDNEYINSSIIYQLGITQLAPCEILAGPHSRGCVYAAFVCMLYLFPRALGEASSLGTHRTPLIKSRGFLPCMINGLFHLTCRMLSQEDSNTSPRILTSN